MESEERMKMIAARCWNAPALLVGILLLLAPALAAQAPADPPKPDASKKNRWTAEDVVYQEDAGQFRISPDGKFALWVKGTADKEKDLRVSNLYLSNLNDGKEVQLTRGTDEVSQPRWSPSGEMIAYLSTHALPKPKPDLAPAQLWLLNDAGGEPWAVTEFERGIRQFEWLDNETVIFSAEEDPSLYERQTKERKDDSNVVDDTAHSAPVRLYKFSVKDKKVTRLTDNDDWIERFEISHDKKKAVAVARRELSFAWDQKIPPVTYIVNLATGERTQVFANERIQPVDVAWARDNSGFYVVAPYSDDPRFLVATVERLYFYDMAAGKSGEVNLDWDRGFARSLEATNDGFIALLADGVYTKPVRFTRHGGTWSRKSITSEDEKHYFSFVLGEDGKTLIYEHSTASVPTQFFREFESGPQEQTDRENRDFAMEGRKRRRCGRHPLLSRRLQSRQGVPVNCGYTRRAGRCGSRPMVRALGVRAEFDDAERRVRAEDELSREHGLWAEVRGIHLLRKVLRAGDSGYRARSRQLDRQRRCGSRADRRGGLVQRLDTFDPVDCHESRPL
jgi:hypothetical protein